MSDLKSIDDQTARLLTDWSQRLSRRGLLARVASLTLKIAGITLVPLLPADRAFAQIGGCGDWRMCNIHGYFCTNCCGGTGSISRCPSCTTQMGAWTGCCRVPVCPKQCRLISYADCCADAGVGTDCRGSQCGDTNWPAYCSGGKTFRCTIVNEAGNCTTC